MTVRLASLTEADAEPTTRWREAARPYLRTPYVRTVAEQREFIRTLPAHRHEYRYWALKAGDKVVRTVGIVGFAPIEFENGLAEVSLVTNPKTAGQGYGGQAFALLLQEAFGALRLEQVIAEVYSNNPAVGFWRHMAEKHGATQTTLPRRKFWNGAFHDAIYFSFPKP